MPNKKYLVTLTSDEREHLDARLRKGKAAALDVGERTISRVRRRFVERGFEACLRRKPQDKPSRERKRDGKAEARLIALACSDPPDGRVVWTMRLPADKLVELAVVDAVSDETVRRAMKKTPSSRGSRSGGAPRAGRAGRSSRRWRT